MLRNNNSNKSFLFVSVTVVGLCVLVLLTQLVSEASAVSNLKRNNNNNNKISVTTTDDTANIDSKITGVSPDTIMTSAPAPTNLTVFVTGGTTSCTRCLFNVSSSQNLTTNFYSLSYFYVLCPFPTFNFKTPTLVYIWLEDCQGQVYSTGAPLVTYSVAPTIQTVSPSNIYATGGVNVTVTLKNSFNIYGFNSGT